MYVFHFSNVADQANTAEVGAKAKGFLAKLLDCMFYLKALMYEDLLVIPNGKSSPDQQQGHDNRKCRQRNAVDAGHDLDVCA